MPTTRRWWPARSSSRRCCAPACSWRCARCRAGWCPADRGAFARRARHHWPPQLGGGLATLVEYLLTERFELVSDLLAGVREPFLASTARLRERLIEEFDGEVIPSGRHRLAINTVDAHSGRVVRYVTRRTPFTRPPDYVVVDAITVDMVLASASIPLLFPTVEIDGRWLWDGGLLVNTPLAPVVALGADEIITVLVTEAPDATSGQFPHLGRAVERTVDAILENAYNVDRKLLLDRNRLAGFERSPYREVTLYEAVRPARDGSFDAGSYLYFERRVLEEMRAAGRRAATRWLAGPRPIASNRCRRKAPLLSADVAAAGRPDVLVVMARQPTPGEVKTRLARRMGAGAACAYHDAFLRDLAASLSGGPGR
ncbi:MAG: patatin-like phospholipase family protein [Candidatus Binatia bacterium]